mgnify:CR=1 FL=1
MNPSLRRIILYSIALLIGYVGVRLGIALYQEFSTPVWKQRLGLPEPLELPPQSVLSEDYAQRWNRFILEILGGPSFGQSAYEELARSIEAPVVNLSTLPEGVTLDDLDPEVVERMMTRSDAITVISERLRVGAPIDPGYEGAFIELLVDGMYQDEDINLLVTSAFGTVNAGLADSDGPHRDRVLEIIAAGEAYISPIMKDTFHEALEKRMREWGVFERPREGARGVSP